MSKIDDVLENVEREKNEDIKFNSIAIKKNIEMARLNDLSLRSIDVLKNKDIDFNNLNQGIHNNKWYFGKLLNDNDKFLPGIVLSSKHIVFGHEGIRDIGIKHYNDLEIQKSYWENEDIKKWLRGNKRTVKRKLYEQIRGKILYYMDFTDESIADLCTCWIVGSYCYELFESYGYLYFNALRNSGKTKIKNILKFMGFNGTEASNISESAFFRTIENRKGVLCLDEYEKLDDTRKRILDQLLNAGHEKNASVVRSEKIKDKWIAREFNVYCPKVICNITGMNPTTRSRCITIKLMRTKKEQGRRQARFSDPEWQDIRNKCYRLVMENWKEINDIYGDYDNSKLINRDDDIWKPLFAIAKFFGGDVERRLIDYSGVNIEESTIDMLEGDWQYELLKAMFEQVSEQGDKWYPTSQIATWIQIPEIKSVSRWVGKKLSSLPLFKRRKMSICNEWYLSSDIMGDVMERLDYPIPEDKSTNSANSMHSDS